jgi:hypothetical protein
MPPRFVLIDPSLTERDGDRWQYAIDSAMAARERGFDFVMLTNRNAPSIKGALEFAIDERFIFDYAFYQHSEIYARHRVFRHAERDAAWNRRFSEEMTRLDKQIDWARERGDVSGRLAWETARSYRMSIARLRGLWHQVRPGASGFKPPFNKDQFALALADALKSLALGRGDHVFCHMTTYAMLESLAEVTQALGHAPPCEATADFIFHFGAEASDARTFLDRYGSYSAYGSIAQRLTVASPFRTMRFLATCPELQAEASDIVGAPVGRWHGLVDTRRLERIFGSWQNLAAVRQQVMADLAKGQMTFIARAADLDAGKARGVSRACHLVQHRGAVVRLKILYSTSSLAKLRDILAAVDFPNLELVDTNDNDEYIRQLATATLAMLVYDAEKYAKRVSGVLHDCAVLGVPAMVPSRSTLQTCEFAATFTYHTVEDLLGATLNATRRLTRDPGVADRLVQTARNLVGGNVLDRLEHNAPKVSIRRAPQAAPIANVIMPLWGRVGSSFAMEGQVRFLLKRGYFVNQVFLCDKPVVELESIEYFWKILRENSQNTRGCVQRVAYVDQTRALEGRDKTAYLKSGGFNQFLHRIGRSKTGDTTFNDYLKRADLTIVNHVFHAEWALANTGGKKVLETHDIQSYGMLHWPLLNEATGSVDNIKTMLASEFAMLKRFDHVINVAPEEHKVLSLANPKSSLITPYIPERKSVARYASVGDMAHQLGWHESYKQIERFDLLITGDSHPANVDSVVWFIEQVFKPYLSPRGISLAITGRVSDIIYQRGLRAPYLFCVGFVDDIESVKALSRMAILPDQRGTGISIKTLDAFASGMPFVATSIALRGLRDRLPPDCSNVDAPGEFAAQITEALNNPDRMRHLSELAQECYRRVASEDVFDAAWDVVLQSLQLHPTRDSSVEEIGQTIPVDRAQAT